MATTADKPATTAATPADPAIPTRRPVAEIEADISTAVAQHRALMLLCDAERDELRDSQDEWDTAKSKLEAMNKGTAGGNRYLQPKIGPRPVLSNEALAHANGLHAMAYVLKDLRDELDGWSSAEQKRSKRAQIMAAAGIHNLALEPEPEIRTAIDHAEARRELLRAAGIAVVDKGSVTS